jgi:hypothetical protein
MIGVAIFAGFLAFCIYVLPAAQVIGAAAGVTSATIAVKNYVDKHRRPKEGKNGHSRTSAGDR